MKPTAPRAEHRAFRVPDLRVSTRFLALDLRLQALERDELISASPAAATVGKLKGHAAVFNQIADFGSHGERIARGAFADTIRQDDIRALVNHDPNRVLGRNQAGTLSLREDARGLAFEIMLLDTQLAWDIVELIERGDVDEMSFAIDVLDEDWKKSAAGLTVRTIRRAKLYDVSVATFPAFDGTDLDVTRKFGTGRPTVERLRRELDFLT